MTVTVYRWPDGTLSIARQRAYESRVIWDLDAAESDQLREQIAKLEVADHE